MRTTLQLAFVLGLCGCGGASSPGASEKPVEAKREREAEQADQPTRTSRYKTGDYVIYQYSGSYTKQPVVLEEVIDRVKGNRLWIHVTATRATDKREWVQVVTDTPENRAKNMVDELYEVRDGKNIKLDNKAHRDLIRLYEWTLPSCQGSPEQLTHEDRSVSIMGKPLECSCIKANQQCNEEPVEMTACDCPDFLWTHASAQLKRAKDGDVLWNVEVVKHGNRQIESADRQHSQPD